jgi:hypothetical protein
MRARSAGWNRSAFGASRSGGERETGLQSLNRRRLTRVLSVSTQVGEDSNTETAIIHRTVLVS